MLHFSFQIYDFPEKLVCWGFINPWQSAILINGRKMLFFFSSIVLSVSLCQRYSTDDFLLFFPLLFSFCPFPCGKRLYSCTLRWKIPHVLFTCVYPNFRSTTIFSHTFKSMNIGTTYFWCVTQFSYVWLFYWLSNIVLTHGLCCSLLPQNSVGDILVNVWRFLIWRVWSFQHLAKSR